jgi:hypothetical protein
LAELLVADPNTAKIAEKLEIPLEHYVAMVVYYMLNPNEQPELHVVSDEDLLRVGGQRPPTADEINQFLEQAAAVAEASEGSAFVDVPKPRVSMPELPQVQVKTPPDPKLQDDLQKTLRSNRGGKT